MAIALIWTSPDMTLNGAELRIKHGSATNLTRVANIELCMHYFEQIDAQIIG